MENYGLIRHGHYQEDYMGDKIVPPVVRQDQFDEEVSHENNAYPELPLLKARLHVELDSVESVDRDHDNQQNRQQENDDVKDDEDSLFAEKLLPLPGVPSTIPLGVRSFFLSAKTMLFDNVLSP